MSRQETISPATRGCPFPQGNGSASFLETLHLGAENLIEEYEPEAHKRGSVLYRPGDQANALYILHEGTVGLFREHADSDRMLAVCVVEVPATPEKQETIQNGQVFGSEWIDADEFNKSTIQNGTHFATQTPKTRSCFAKTLTDVSVSAVPRRTALKVFDASPKFRNQILHSQLAQLRYTQSQLDITAYGELRNRIADTLLRYVNPQTGVVTLAHWQLAELTGSHRETVSALMRKFRDEGLINQARLKITVPDLEAMELLATDF